MSEAMNGATAATTAIERSKERVNGIVKSGKLSGAKSDDIVAILSSYETQIAQALPKAAQDLNAQRIIQIAATVIGANDKLKECDLGSVVAAVMQAAILGLNPMPSMAEVYFVPYNSRVKNAQGKWVNADKALCQMQIGYKGYVNIYHRGRIIGSVRCGAVAQGDLFDYSLGSDQYIKHKPLGDVDPNGRNLTHVWALAKYVNGHEVFVVLTKEQVERLRRRSPMAQFDPDKLSGGWEKDYAAMAMAKALKQLKRTIPTDSSIDAAMASDEIVPKLEHFANDRSGRLDVDMSRIETGHELADVIESVSASPTMTNGVSNEVATLPTGKPSEVATDLEGRVL